MAAMAARPSNSGRAPTPPPTAAGATATAGAIVGSGTTGEAAAASTTGRTQPGPAAAWATAAPAAAAAWAAPAAQTAARDSDVPKTLRATSGSIERGAAAAAELASSDTAAKAAVYFRINATLNLPSDPTPNPIRRVTCTGMDETQVTGRGFGSPRAFSRSVAGETHVSNSRISAMVVVPCRLRRWPKGLRASRSGLSEIYPEW